MSNEKEESKSLVIKPKLPNNVMVFQEFANLAAHKLSYTAMKILLLFFGQSGYENYVYMDIKMLSGRLSLNRKTIIAGLKELEVFNIIVKEKDGDDGRIKNYFINPMTAWKGNSTQRVQMIGRMKHEGMDLHLTELKVNESKRANFKELENKFDSGKV